MVDNLLTRNNKKQKEEVRSFPSLYMSTLWKNGLDEIEVSMIFLVVTFFVGR